MVPNLPESSAFLPKTGKEQNDERTLDRRRRRKVGGMLNASPCQKGCTPTHPVVFVSVTVA